MGCKSEIGPQMMLIQLLPSSTVADGVRLNTGVGRALASLVPGVTCKPRPRTPEEHASRCSTG